MSQDRIAAPKPRRDFRTSYWSREFAHLNRRRCTWILAALLLNLAIHLTGWGQTSVDVATGYIGWLATVVAFEVLRRFIDGRVAVIWWSTAAFGVDVFFVALVMYLSGGGWWIGAPFFGVIVAIAALGLPSLQGRLVFVACLLAWTALFAAQLFSDSVPEPWFGLPSVRDNVQLLATQYALGLFALSALWVLMRTQNRRIRRAQQSNRRMVESAPYAIFTMGRDGSIREANPAALRLTAFALEEVLGRSILPRVTSELQVVALDAFSRTLEGEVVHFEHGFRCGDDVERWFSVTYSPIDTNVGERAVLAIARDLTAERQAELANARMQRELAESRRMELVGRLVSGVAHELNNPLAAVMSFTEQLLAESRDDDSRQALQVVHSQAGRARAIVRDLLQVVRDRGERARSATDLAALVQGCVHALQPPADEASVSLRVEVVNSEPRAVVDAVGVAQVIDNLVRNAILASPAGGVVCVSLDHEDSGWRVTVADQGEGVAESVRAHLFEPFFTTRAPGEGTGLGLAVSQGIAEQHGGTISFENVAPIEGTGARFTLHLPVHLAAAAADDPPAAPELVISRLPFLVNPLEHSHMLISRRLLLVDDEAAIRMALERFLTRRGWRVETCGSGLEARDLLMAEGDGAGFDAVVCDLKMPGMTGIELYKYLGEHRPRYISRLILATGDVASQEVATFLDGVHCPVLEKPFGLARLAQLLEEIAPHTGAGPALSVA